MKTLQTLLSLILWTLLGAITVFGTPPTSPGPGCLPLATTDPAYGTREDNIYYTDCFPALSGETDDGPRLDRAVIKAQSKLIFNEEVYSVSQTIDLHSYLTIEGLSPAKSASAASRINYKVDGDGVFRIKSEMRQISIRDLSFVYSPASGQPATATAANGIFAQATSTTLMNSTQGVEFTNLKFTSLYRGIYVGSPVSGGTTYDGWQFDDVHISDSTFDQCQYAIYLDTLNTGWQMNNLMISSLAGQHGIWIQRGAYVSMNMIVGNGTYGANALPTAGEFIHLDKYHGPTSIQNSNGEAYKGSLWIKGRALYKIYPVELINNVLPSCPTTADNEGVVFGYTINFTSGVGVHDTSVYSHGNYFTCNYGTNEKLTRPEIRGHSDVFSTADKFCPHGGATCFEDSSKTRSEWALMTNTGVLRRDNVVDLGIFNGSGIPAFDFTQPLVEIVNSHPSGGTTESPKFKPLLKLSTSHYNPSPSGTPDPDPDYAHQSVVEDAYTFSQNSQTGRLEINGDQNSVRDAGRKPGYRFNDGPLQLHKVTQSQLSSYNQNINSYDDSGSLLYCSDCVPNSYPCAASGVGALAIKVGTAWHCK